MDWVGEYHYTTIRQQERLARGKEPGWALDLEPLCKWVAALRGKLTFKEQSHPRMVLTRE